jgi:monothiol glutaredoxin
MDSAIKDRIDNDIKSNRVMLYMKGSPTFPQCGFSARVADILNSYKIEYGHFDVLSDMDIREGIKAYSDWPTIPQLYIDGEFIGGCDIVTELHMSGDLAGMLGSETAQS